MPIVTSTEAHKTDVSRLYDGSASLEVQTDAAERLMRGAMAGRGMALGGGGSAGSGSRRRYGALRRVHAMKEVLDWVLSPRGMARLYAEHERNNGTKKETGTKKERGSSFRDWGSRFDLFVRMWVVVRDVLVASAGDPESEVSGVSDGLDVLDVMGASRARTLPVVATRMAAGLRVFGRGTGIHDDRMDNEMGGGRDRSLPYGVLADVVEVLCAGVRGRTCALQGDGALGMLEGAVRVVQAVWDGLEHRMGDEVGEALRFAEGACALYVLQMGRGGGLPEEVVGGVSFGAFLEGDGRVVEGLRESCREMLRRVLFGELVDERKGEGHVAGGVGGDMGVGVGGDVAARKKVLRSFVAWVTPRTPVHPRLVAWIVESYPHPPSSLSSSSSSYVYSSSGSDLSTGGVSISDVFFGLADAYMREADRGVVDVEGLSRLLGALKVRGVHVYRSAGEEGRAMFARLTAISDFLLGCVPGASKYSNASAASGGGMWHTLVAAVDGLDSILAVEHRGIERNLAGYWSLLAAMGECEDGDDGREGNEGNEGNECRKNALNAVFRSFEVFLVEYNKLRRLDVLFQSMDFRSGRCWDTIAGSRKAMDSVERVLRQIPVGQSSRFVDLVSSWCALLREDERGLVSTHRAVSRLSCAIIENVPVDLNNAVKVAQSLQGVLREEDAASSVTIDVVTKALEVHDRCCRIDPNILPLGLHGLPRDFPMCLMTDMLEELRSAEGGAPCVGTARSLVAAILYRLKIECQARSAAQTRVGSSAGFFGGTFDAVGDSRGGDGGHAAARKRQKREDCGTDSECRDRIARLVIMMGEALGAFEGKKMPDMSDLIDTDAWWFAIAMDCLGATETSKLIALRRLLLSSSSPVRAGRAFCIQNVQSVVTNMAPKRQVDSGYAERCGVSIPVFVGDVDPAAVRHHFELLEPSIGTQHIGNFGNYVAVMRSIYELCMAHCVYALRAEPRDDAHIERVVSGLVRHAERTRTAEYSTEAVPDRVRASVALLEMALGIDSQGPQRSTSLAVSVQLGRLASAEAQVFCVGELGDVLAKDDAPVVSLVIVRGLLRADQSRSDVSKRIICDKLATIARRTLDETEEHRSALQTATLASTYAAALWSNIVSEDLLSLVPEVFATCISAARTASRHHPDRSFVVEEVSEFLDAYAFIATSIRPRMSTAGLAAVLDALLRLLGDMPRGVGAGHLCRPNAPKEAIAIAASSFDAKGKSRRCVLRAVEKLVSGSTRDECKNILEVALGGSRLEHAELLLLMLEDTDNGVLRDLLSNQVDNIVFTLVETLCGTTGETLRTVTILRCLESIVCRPTRFSKLSKRGIGVILSGAAQLVEDSVATMPPSVDKDACFDAVCHLARGMLRHQTSTIGRYLHLVAGVVAALQGALAIIFLERDGEEPISENLLEGLSRTLEEFSRVRAVEPYLKDALLTHVKLFMAPVSHASLEQCLSNGLYTRVPSDRIGSVLLHESAAYLLSPGIAAVFGACSEDAIQDVFASLASKNDGSQWRLRLDELKGIYEREVKYTGKV